MIFGVLRWKYARQLRGLWRVMYMQVEISRIADATYNRTQYWLWGVIYDDVVIALLWCVSSPADSGICLNVGLQTFLLLNLNGE